MADTATIYLVRHAQAEEAGSDPGLSAVGNSQAKLLAEKFREREIALILHSPKRRAVETAAAVAAPLPQVEVRSSELLDDRTPVPSAELRADYSARFLQWLEGVPEQERDVDGVAIGTALEQLVESARHHASRGAVLAITHNFVIGGMIPRILDVPTSAWMKFDSANAGTTRIDCSDAGMRLISFNEPLA